jgi:hypothetical protein
LREHYGFDENLGSFDPRGLRFSAALPFSAGAGKYPLRGDHQRDRRCEKARSGTQSARSPRGEREKVVSAWFSLSSFFNLG